MDSAVWPLPGVWQRVRERWREETEAFCVNLETAEKQEKTVWDHRGVPKGSNQVVKEEGLSMNEMERGA